MNRHSPLRLAIFCLATLSASAFADMITLKSGEKIEGKVLSETETEITIAAKVTATITDERVVKKADIETITKDAPDEIAWLALKNVRLGKNSFPVASYDAVINPLRGFQSEFPQSKFAADSKKIMDAFSAEKKRVEDGEVKLDDKWLSKEEAQKEGVQIKGLVAFNFMKDQSTRDMTAALNTLDAIEKNFPGTRAYPDAVEYAQRMLPALKAEVDRRLKTLAAQKIEQTEAMKKLKGPEKTKLEEERKRALALGDAATAAAEKQGLKWLPLNLNTERALKNLESKITSETSRLNAVPVAKMRASIASAEQARKLLESKDLAGAEAALTQASTNWSANELSTRLRAELDEAKKAVVPVVAAAEPEILPPVPAETAPAAKDNENEPAAVAEVVESDKPFLLTPAGAITLVIIGAILVAAFSALKKFTNKADENAE